MRKLALLAATALIAAPLALVATAPAQANGTRGNDYWIEFHNLTGNLIYEIYATNLDNPDWGWNKLGQALQHDWTIWIDVDDYTGYCIYDIMAIDQYGRDYTWYGVNVCELNHWDIW